MITIVPRNEPIACTTAYLAFEQLGAGHYDLWSVIESTVKTTFADDKPSSNGRREDILGYSEPYNYPTPCQCGQGATKKKQV